jgi:hypothetical protein
MVEMFVCRLILSVICQNVFFFCMIMIDQVNMCLFAVAVDY